VDPAAVSARVSRRLVTFAFICYVVAYIDRVNIGFAAAPLQRSLGLSATELGIGGGLFFLGYCLFEIPSNLILERVGARRWIARILVVWGLVSMGMALVSDARTFYAARVLLGVAEAGFFPGMVLYFTYWIPAAERAGTTALFMIAQPVAVILGAPLSALLLGLDGRGGLAGWQWLFIGEGLPAIVLGIAALRVLTDRPEQATWLTRAQRESLAERMAQERAASPGRRTSMTAGMGSPTVWLLSTIYFLNALVSYGVLLWLPKILHDLSGADTWRLAAITVIPFAAATVAMIVVGRHSDRTGERKRHVAACALTAAAGLALAAAVSHSLPLLVLAFTVSQIGQRSILSVFWAIPPIVLGGTAAAAGIGLINSVGNLGGFVGPSVMGWLRDATGAYASGLLVLAAALVVEAALVMTLKLPDHTRSA